MKLLQYISIQLRKINGKHHNATFGATEKKKKQKLVGLCVNRIILSFISIKKSFYFPSFLFSNYIGIIILKFCFRLNSSFLYSNIDN